MKVPDLGTPSPSNNARIFAKNLHRIFDDLGYKNYQKYELFRKDVRSNIRPLALLMLLSDMQAGLDYFSVIITK